MNNTETLTVREAAAYLGVTTSSVRALVAAGKLAVTERVESPAGTYWLLSRQSVQHYHDTRKPVGRPRK